MALHKDREGRFTASSHAVALGHGYQSPQAFWRRWHGMESHDDQAKARMQYGTDHEADACAEYEIITGDIVTHQQEWIAWEDWSGATLDGRTQYGVVDFKVPSTMYEEVPIKHWVQLQSQMHFSDEGTGDLCAWSPTEIRIWRTRKSPDYWSLVESILKRYYSSLVAGLEPKRGEFKKIPLEATWERIA